MTFAVSAIERVIEERARGDADAASSIRAKLEGAIGGGIRSIVPGTDDAARLKATLIEDGMWSQYLEVAIGPDAEIFTKSPVLSTIGWGECRDRRAIRFDLEQSRTRDRAALPTVTAGSRSARRWATMSIFAISRAARRCC